MGNKHFEKGGEPQNHSPQEEIEHLESKYAFDEKLSSDDESLNNKLDKLAEDVYNIDESLSSKMRIFKEGEETWTDGTQEIFLSKDVKEFVKKLKEIPMIKQMGIGGKVITEEIDKLAGSELI